MNIAKLISNLRISSSDTIPLYIQLANALAAKIQDSTIAKGTKLPPERELADLLEVSRTTTVNAYRFLEQRGLIFSKRGSGTYVNDLSIMNQQKSTMPWEQLFTPQNKSSNSSILRTIIATPTENQVISFSAGMPDPSLYPIDIIDKALSEKNAINPADYGHIETEGDFLLRQSLVNWQTQFGIDATVDQSIIVSGSQQGLYLITKTFVEPQDYVIVESPTYLGAIQILESFKARILTLPTSGSMNLELLEDYLIRYRPKLMYTIPTFQNPTGRVMSIEDRRALIRLAANYRLAIVEDDPYSLLHYGDKPPSSLKSLDNYGGVIYLGTFSKILFPGLRTGWITASQPVINRLAQEKQFVDLHNNNLSQIVLRKCLKEDYLSAHLSLVRAEYKKRRDAMSDAIQRYCGKYVRFNVPDGGFYFWCTIDESISVTDLVLRTATAGVSILPGLAFYPNGIHSNEIRLCFVTHKEELLQEGIERMARILNTSCKKRNSLHPFCSSNKQLI